MFMRCDELIPIVPDWIWGSERALWFAGVRLRVRTTVLRFSDGGVLIHSPAPPTESGLSALRELGNVRYLLVPNCFHHLATPALAKALPSAKVIGPASEAAKNPALRIDLDIHSLSDGVGLPGLSCIPLFGVPFLDETLVYHSPTGTLVGADVAIRADSRDHWTWRIAARLTWCYERLSVPPDVRKKIEDRTLVAASFRRVQAFEVRRLIVAHGGDP
mgnify:CR=1 FL=1